MLCLKDPRVEQILLFYLFLCCVVASCKHFHHTFYFHSGVKTRRRKYAFSIFYLIKIYGIILVRVSAGPEMLRRTGIYYGIALQVGLSH
jgi:hypothetical protein